MVQIKSSYSMLCSSQSTYRSISASHTHVKKIQTRMCQMTLRVIISTNIEHFHVQRSSVLNALYVSILTTIPWGTASVILGLQVRILRHREVKLLAQGYAHTWLPKGCLAICGWTGDVYHGDQIAKKDTNAVLNQIQNYIYSVFIQTARREE